MNRWYVLFAKPKKETQVQQQLEEMDVGTFLPLMPRTRLRGRQVDRPLFPRYLFAQLQRFPGGVGAANWLPGLVCVVRFGGEYALVPSEVLDDMRWRLCVEEQRARTPFQRGQRLRLAADGPLGPLEVLFEQQLADGKRAHVLIEILGRLTRSEVSIEDLARVAPAASGLWHAAGD